MSLVPADVASPHVPEISVLQVQNTVPCPVVVSPASVTGCATWCLLMESWQAPPVKTLASLVPVSTPSLPKTSEILVLFYLTEAWGRPMVGEAVPNTSEMVCAGRQDGCHVGEQRMDHTGPTRLQG